MTSPSIGPRRQTWRSAVWESARSPKRVCEISSRAASKTPNDAMPKLLRSGRTHPATVPIPEDWAPCLHLYPTHPYKDRLGATKPFNAAEFSAFQKALAFVR
jgi:hypothetical protein